MSDNEASPVENLEEIKSLKTLDKFLAARNIANNAVYISNVPKVCKDYPCVLGIDEAGRGPVLGPMVYGIAFCPIHRADLLIKLECDDSKALTEEKRESIFGGICENSKAMGWAVDVISPNAICNNMLSKGKVSLNELSMNSAISLIRRAAAADVNIEHIFVDTVGPPEKYEAKLQALFPKYKVTVAKKADSKYPVVSAASICAKVTRDHALKVWDFKEDIKLGDSGFGSGYPGDPITKKFMNDLYDPVFGYPQLVRFSWSTASKILENNAYHVEFDEEEVAAPEDNTSITSFFKPQGNLHTQHEFFKTRALKSTTSLT